MVSNSQSEIICCTFLNWQVLLDQISKFALAPVISPSNYLTGSIENPLKIKYQYFDIVGI